MIFKKRREVKFNRICSSKCQLFFLFVPEFFFTKKSNFFCFFSKTQGEIVNWQNMDYFTKTQGQIQFFLSQNFEILCYDLSIIQKIAKNGYFFEPVSWDFTFSKIEKNALVIIIILINLTKSDNFCQKFSTKIENFLLFLIQKQLYRRYAIF